MEIDWDLAPEGAVEVMQNSELFSWVNGKGEYWDWLLGEWSTAHAGSMEKVVATRPQPKPEIIAWKDMKEGMVVRCVECESDWYTQGEHYKVGKDKAGRLGPLNMHGRATPSEHKYKFTLVSDPLRKTVADAVGEAEVKRRESEETCQFNGYPYTYGGRNYKKVYGPNSHGQYLAECEDDGRWCAITEMVLEKRKPTITKAEMLDMIQDMARGVASDGHFGDTVRGWLDKYTITD